MFTLARFSEAFLVIRAHDAGLALAWTPAVIGIMSLVFAATAYPAGRLQDRIGARPLLLLGLVVLIAADMVLALAGSLVGIFVGIGLWGLHMGLTQGVLSALIAGTAPARLRGTAFGLFGLVLGVATLDCEPGRRRALGQNRAGGDVPGRCWLRGTSLHRLPDFAGTAQQSASLVSLALLRGGSCEQPAPRQAREAAASIASSCWSGARQASHEVLHSILPGPWRPPSESYSAGAVRRDLRILAARPDCSGQRD